MSTVTETHSMRCPQCGDDDRIEVAASVWVRLTADGADADEARDGSMEWDNQSACQCTACDYSATVAIFRAAAETDSGNTPESVMAEFDLSDADWDAIPAKVARALISACDVRDKRLQIVLRHIWLCNELHHGNEYSKEKYWEWLKEAELHITATES